MALRVINFLGLFQAQQAHLLSLVAKTETNASCLVTQGLERTSTTAHPPTLNNLRSPSKMSAMEVDIPPPAAAKKKSGKDDGKKRFEVKKVLLSASILFDRLEH